MAKASLSRIIRQRIMREEVSKERLVHDVRWYFSTVVYVNCEYVLIVHACVTL